MPISAPHDAALPHISAGQKRARPAPSLYTRTRHNAAPYTTPCGARKGSAPRGATSANRSPSSPVGVPAESTRRRGWCRWGSLGHTRASPHDFPHRGGVLSVAEVRSLQGQQTHRERRHPPRPKEGLFDWSASATEGTGSGLPTRATRCPGVANHPATAPLSSLLETLLPRCGVLRGVDRCTQHREVLPSCGVRPAHHFIQVRRTPWIARF